MTVDLTKPVEIQRRVLYEGDYYTEGPVVDGLGGFFFTTLTGGSIWHWQEATGAVYWAGGGWPNGQARYADGLVVCDSKNRRIAHYDCEGNALPDLVRNSCAGKRMSVPNDVVADQYGGLYFTDSVRHKGHVFYRSTEGATSVVAKGLDYPNGLALTHGEGGLVVAESYANRLLYIRMASPGLAAGVDVFCELPNHASGRPEANLPDGLALDDRGCVWVAHYGMGVIQVVDGSGRLLTSFPTGVPLTSNLCFDGEGTIFVTGGLAEPGPGMVVEIALKNK